ncbi:MAG: flavodoxin-dependent (E)-4-hydroxy-3-methylbut-2-enyl-diphosphate synthase [Planctomycetes bacterium]|nr:flavodoxin-dependent (E)-4-hydroxy-3-methylbut-2-enyl-diphosphate synthase [Planctomycetota bacterium]
MNQIKRHKTRAVWIGPVKVGGGAPISIQSMTKTDATDIKATVRQIKELEDAGCEIIRIAIPDMATAQVIAAIKRQIKIPVEADIHFNPKLALEVISQGVDSVRLNPGNIPAWGGTPLSLRTNKDAIREIVRQALKRKIPIRVGVNSGSVPQEISPQRQRSVREHNVQDRRGLVSSSLRGKRTVWERMVDAALDYCRYLESLKFRDIMVSLKASDTVSTILAYRKIAAVSDYPLHLGVTAAGPAMDSSVKSAIGIGTLLLEGIGDTIRVSVTGASVDEVRIGQRILEAVGLRQPAIEVISCPTCGRCKIDVIKMTEELNTALDKFRNPRLRRGFGGQAQSAIRNTKVAVMGCVVNGPGEAKEADIGIAGGVGFGFLFKHGKKIKKVKQSQIVRELVKQIIAGK